MSHKAAKRGRLAVRDELNVANAHIVSLQDQLAQERLMRVSAQAGLADDINTPCYSCGKPWRPPGQRKVGYDPRKDPGLAQFFGNAHPT